jgi:eukaryotic-like serine/threonine-protein kinase
LSSKRKDDGERAKGIAETQVAQPYTGESHPSGDDAAPERHDSAPLPRGEALGRYLVLDRIGMGGMGEVYAAFDPELDRRVALKLLLENPAGQEEPGARQRRLLREARAMARLAHPNVITVHDVGTLGDRVFIAMEFVAGPTLGHWLRQERTQAEIVKVFAQAARGLAAAHDAGLVHRDFKPDNVLVGDDGRVRVTDFGLARAPAEGDGASVEPDSFTQAKTAPAHTAVDTTPPVVRTPGDARARTPQVGSGPHTPHTPGALDKVTRPGFVVGTPEYMAPEQYSGKATDPRTDQFSFCVALYEALYGERPFDADTARGLAVAVVGGAVRKAPKNARVPQYLREAILRGLEVDPAARFATMEDLLDAIERDPAGRKRRLGLAIVLGLGLVALVVAGARGQGKERMCTGAEASLVGVWDDARKGQIDASLHVTGVPFADDATRAIHKGLDAYAAEWTAARTDACVATRVRGVQSDQVFTLRTRCLDERLEHLRALTDAFAHADRDTAEHAAGAVADMPLLASCSDTAALTARVPPPDDPAIFAQVSALRDKLARARVLGESGKAKDALAQAKDLADLATQTRYRPVEAEALALRGGLEYEVGELKHAHETLLAAVAAAEAGRSDELAAELWATLVGLSGGMLLDAADATRCEQRARAALERAGGGGLAELLLLDGLGQTLHGQHKYVEAEAKHREALALAKKLFGPEHPRVAKSLMRLGRELRDQRRVEEAIVTLTEAVAVTEKIFGPEHPDVAEVVNSLGIAQAYAGQYDAARVSYERALSIREKVLGPDHPAVAIALVNLALSIRRSGETARPTALLERAIAIEEKSLGHDHSDTADAVLDLGIVEEQTGKLDVARATYEKARAMYVKALGPTHAEVARAERNIGHVLLRAGKYADAVAAFTRARAIDEPRSGGSTAEVAAELIGIGRAEVALGHEAAALRVLEEAETIGKTKRLPHEVKGELYFALAKASYAVKKDRDLALALAKQAADEFAAGGAWLDADRAAALGWNPR